MSYESFGDITDAVEDLVGGFARAKAVLPLIRRGEATRRDLQGLASAATGLRAEAREIRREIDVVDAVDFLDIVDGQRTLATWIWQRELRKSLGRMATGLLTLERQVGEVVSGQHRRTVVVRQGDTWQSIAQRELGDWQAWKALLEANSDVAPGALSPGTVLVVPVKR
jgi:nucleoid-associated protein YgaU